MGRGLTPYLHQGNSTRIWILYEPFYGKKLETIDLLKTPSIYKEESRDGTKKKNLLSFRALGGDRPNDWGTLLNTLTLEHDPHLQESCGFCVLPLFCWERPEGPESWSTAVTSCL